MGVGWQLPVLTNQTMPADNTPHMPCRRAAGIPRALVGHKVAVLGLRPTLPPFTPADFRALVEDCWHQDPEKRWVAAADRPGQQPCHRLKFGAAEPWVLWSKHVFM